jgi:class 3 adenylate cyclase/quinol monooxygenase YgiN
VEIAPDGWEVAPTSQQMVSWIEELSVKPGRLEEFLALTNSQVAATRREPGTLVYERFVSDDGSVVHIYERYADSAAVIAHLSRFESDFRERFYALVDHVSFTVYGAPTPEVRAALGAHGAQSYLRCVEGFARLAIDEVADSVARERPDVTGVTASDGTVTIMFTDIESSTEWNERLGDERWLDVIRGHDQLVRSEVNAHGGIVIKGFGDGYMAAFASPDDALHCAIGLQRRVCGSAGGDVRVRVRAGLHVGRPIAESNDFYGRDVNYAARVAGAAGAEEILVSESFVRAAHDLTVAPDSARVVNLKGFADPQTLYALPWRT